MLADSEIMMSLLYVGEFPGIGVIPYDSAQMNPASYDLTLSAAYRHFGETEMLDVADIAANHTTGAIADDLGRIVLAPGDFILAATREEVTVPTTLGARVEGKSSLGRLGLAVHITAGFIDPGFRGSITLEIANLNRVPITLRAGMRIAQIAFHPVVGKVGRPYGLAGHYQHQPAGIPIESRYVL